MKFLRENLVYIVLALIAVVLVIITISLQTTILTTQGAPGEEGNGNILTLMRRQLAELLLPATEVPTTVSLPTTLPLPTNTPIMIVLQPTVAPPPTALTASEPTALPPVALEAVTTTTVTTQPASAVLASDSAVQLINKNILITQTQTASKPTPQPTPPLTFTSPPAADLRFGVVNRPQDCSLMTAVVEQILTTHFQLEVKSDLFASPEQLFDGLARRAIDLTFCFVDPLDRPLMRAHLGQIRQIGSQQFVAPDNTYKLQLWANGAVSTELRNQRRCVLDFLEKLDFTTLDLQAPSADAWIQANSFSVEQWLNCPYK
ncbi:MAG: hypothetical protein R3C14_22210 [Caldilineaceae bacterium]